MSIRHLPSVAGSVGSFIVTTGRLWKHFGMWCKLAVLALAPLLVLANYISRNETELLNWCIKGRHHKAQPGPESSLYQQCLPWKDRSCCTEELTEDLHLDNPYNFDFNHCPGRNLSDECQQHFVQDHCFYERSPNVGPWVVAENRTWRKERFYKVPLCASDCDDWFSSCANDYTCTNNWARNFEWSTPEDGNRTTNACPAGAKCATFREVFGDAKTFCETVWDDSWKYTNDSDPCMRLWFNGTDGNPNDGVAQLHARELANAPTISGAWCCVYRQHAVASSVILVMAIERFRNML